VIARLRRDELDAGLVATSVGGADVYDQVLFREPFVGYVSPKHRLARQASIKPTDLSIDDLWLLSEGHCFRSQAVRLCKDRSSKRARSAAACTVGARFESGNLETLKRLVEGGSGMTLLPWLATQDLRGDQRALAKPFASPAPHRTVRLVRRRAFLRQHLIDAVIEVLVSSLPAELKRRPR
jgi:LysR family hydrogen peroxide-inducible transcriptional activator